jgi:hypothetical protein
VLADDVQAGAAAGPSYAKSPQEARDPRSPDRCRALGGILVRKERWTLSLTGKLLALAVTVCVLFAVCWKAHPFLAVTSRVNGELLIIEGWIPTYTLNQAASEFARGHYQRVLVVRPVYDTVDKYESGRYWYQPSVRAAARPNPINMLCSATSLLIPRNSSRMVRSHQGRSLSER